MNLISENKAARLRGDPALPRAAERNASAGRDAKAHGHGPGRRGGHGGEGARGRGHQQGCMPGDAGCRYLLL